MSQQSSDPLISDALRAELDAFEKLTGIPSAMVVHTSVRAALDYYAGHQHIEVPMQIEAISSVPENITRIWEHLLPSHPKNPNKPA